MKKESPVVEEPLISALRVFFDSQKKRWGWLHDLLLVLIGGAISLAGTVVVQQAAKKDKATEAVRNEWTQRRHEGLTMLETMAGNVNRLISPVMGWIRSPRNGADRSQIFEYRGNLFTERLRHRVKCQSVFGSKEISNSYDKIVWELHDLTEELQQMEQSTAKSELPKNSVAVERISALKEGLASKTPRFKPVRPLPPPYEVYEEWANLIWATFDETVEEAITRLEKRPTSIGHGD